MVTTTRPGEILPNPDPDKVEALVEELKAKAGAAPKGENPKHASGMAKASFQHIPAPVLVMLGEVMRHGAVKYGSHNWRETSVDQSIYFDAIMRHLLAWRDGQYMDPDSGMPHLAHVMACCAVVLDSNAGGHTLIGEAAPVSAGAAVDLMSRMAGGSQS